MINELLLAPEYMGPIYSIVGIGIMALGVTCYQKVFGSGPELQE